MSDALIKSMQIEMKTHFEMSLPKRVAGGIWHQCIRRHLATFGVEYHVNRGIVACQDGISVSEVEYHENPAITHFSVE